ncbi:MAG: biopolymer transporter ExbD [Proteobacteria bacterium]|jgi:biopolymer transport protein ExbD|nr:biopolymer transporter ExbD [Pseudomonadota bacterium]
MGVSIESAGGRGGKKSLNAELNLVPFIDLLVCCICFLLITAAWSAMSSMEVNQKGRGSIGKPNTEEPQKLDVPVTVLVGQEGYVVSAGSVRDPIPKQGDTVYDVDALGKRLRDLKSELQTRDDLTIAVEDGVFYRHIIDAMDVALQQNFTSIRLTDASAAKM